MKWHYFSEFRDQHVNPPDPELHAENTGTEEVVSDELYPGHQPTTCAQKVLLALGSGAMSLAAPWRGGEFKLVGIRKMFFNQPVNQSTQEF